MKGNFASMRTSNIKTMISMPSFFLTVAVFITALHANEGINTGTFFMRQYDMSAKKHQDDGSRNLISGSFYKCSNNENCSFVDGYAKVRNSKEQELMRLRRRGKGHLILFG